MDNRTPNIRAIRLWNSFSPSYFPMLVLSSVFGNLSPYFNLYLSAEIINEISGSRNPESLIFLIGITVIGNFLISVVGAIISRFYSHSGTILLQKEDQYYMQKILKMDYASFENPEVRQLRRKIVESSGINRHGKQLLLDSVSRIVNSIVSLIIGICFCIELFVKAFTATSWTFILFSFVSIIFLIILNIVYSFKIKEKNSSVFNKISQTMIDINRVDNAIDCYNMGKDIRLYRLDSIIMNIKNNFCTSHKRAFESTALYQFKTSIPLLIIMDLLNIFVYIFVIINAKLGAFGVGSIIKYVGLSQKFIECILGIFRGATDIKTNTRFIEDYLAYFDIPHKMEGGKLHIKDENSIDTIQNYKIEFRDVSFKYPSCDVYALRHISITITAGMRIGIVGQNGSGKTTFIKLLCRLYDPSEGEICLNGINIKEYDYHEYMSLMSVVFQDYKLFSFSLGQNVAAGEFYDKLRVEECLCKTGFKERLESMKDGVETCLYKDFDENGVEISGGEAQKIALARTLYKEAPIIVLDEPTAALDPIAESEIYVRFNEIVKGRTSVYISHRLSSCRYCDEIFVFDGGNIVQTGSHEELVAVKSGKYHELWFSQAQYYIE